MTWSAALSDTHPDPAKRRDGPRTNVALCGTTYAVLGGGFINKGFKTEGNWRNSRIRRRTGRVPL